MLRKIIFVLCFTFLFTSILSSQEKSKELKNSSDVKQEVVKDVEVKKPWNAVCPVKGNPVDEETPTVEYKGKVYGFCCPGCDTKFAKNPEKYIKNLSEDGKKFIGRR